MRNVKQRRLLSGRRLTVTWIIALIVEVSIYNVDRGSHGEGPLRHLLYPFDAQRAADARQLSQQRATAPIVVRNGDTLRAVVLMPSEPRLRGEHRTEIDFATLAILILIPAKLSWDTVVWFRRQHSPPARYV